MKKIFQINGGGAIHGAEYEAPAMDVSPLEAEGSLMGASSGTAGNDEDYNDLGDI